MIDRITEQPFCQTRVSGSTFVNADCFDVFPFIEDKSIDAIICDLPYGTTACKWDTIIPFDRLWEQYERIIKPNGAIVLFGSQPFTSALVMSNPKLFKYEWIWEKSHPTGLFCAKYQPMKYHENICVFSKNKTVYNPQMWEGKKNHRTKTEEIFTEHYGKSVFTKDKLNGIKYPKSIQKWNCENRVGLMHPTQKPLELLEYLVKTYTNEGDVVLDNTMGSGTTNLACIKLNRKSIGIEKEKQYYDVAVRRASEYCH